MASEWETSEKFLKTHFYLAVICMSKCVDPPARLLRAIHTKGYGVLAAKFNVEFLNANYKLKTTSASTVVSKLFHQHIHLKCIFWGQFKTSILCFTPTKLLTVEGVLNASQTLAVQVSFAKRGLECRWRCGRAEYD